MKSNKREKPVYWQLTRATTPRPMCFDNTSVAKAAPKSHRTMQSRYVVSPIGYAFINPWSQWRRQKLLAKLIYEYLKTNKSLARRNSTPLTVPIMPIIPNCYHPFSSAIPKAHLLELNQKNKDSWPKLIIPYSF